MLETLIDNTTALLSGKIIPLLMVVATVSFIYALVMYIVKSGEEQTQIKMKNMMLWSIIALAVIVSMWSLIKMVSLFIGTASIPTTIGW